MEARRHRLERVTNSVTHAIGFGLGIAALVLLVVWAARNGDAWQITSVSIYGATLVTLYLASTLYHSLASARCKHVLRVVDHAAIYLLIAGTYTPFMLISVRGGWGWSIFGVVWGLALFGSLLVWLSLKRFSMLTWILSLLMGWIVLIAIVPIVRSVPPAGLAWLLGGGIAYTVGVLFFLSRKFLAHTAWHLTVLLGSVCHFFAVLTILPR